MRKRLITLVIMVLITVGVVAPASAHHEDPNCTITIHPPILGQAKVFLLCDHGHP